MPIKKTFKKLFSARNFVFMLIAVLGIFATGLSCGGGNRSAQEQVTLTFWKPFDATDKWQEIISAYQASRPGVNIQYTQKPIETYEQDLLEAMAAGSGPDIYSIRNDWVPRHRSRIHPLPSERIDLREFRNTFLPVVEEDFLHNNQLYALPMAVDVLAMFYNRDHLSSAGIARPPETWPALVDLVPSLTQTVAGEFRQSATALGTSNNVNRGSDILSLLMLQSGTQFYGQGNTSVTVTQGPTDNNNEFPAARALRFYTQFANPRSSAYTWNNRRPDSIDAFVQGEVSFLFGYNYLIPTLADKQAFLNYGITGIPQVSSTAARVNLASYWAETIWNGSPYRDMAWDFILFATSYEQNQNYIQKTNMISSRVDIVTQQQRDPVLGPFADNALSARSVKKPDQVQFDNLLNTAIDDVNLSGLQPTEAIQKLQSQLQLLLRRQSL